MQGMHDATKPKLSLVIPARNEEQYLPALLNSVAEARANYQHGADSVEVIVADNGSTDATAPIARQHGCQVIQVEKRVIAAVRNGGAAAASGEILSFVDADMVVHPQILNAIQQALENEKVVAGASGAYPDRWSLGLRVTWWMMLPLTVLTGLDTGVIYCRREDFQAIGGYNERRLFAEDVQFLWDLRRLGRSRGQRLKRLPRFRAQFSTRKFERYGEWHYFTLILRLGFKMLTNPSYSSDWVRAYWYEDRH